MSLSSVVLLLFACAIIVSSQSVGGKIWGGKTISITQRPYQAQLTINGANVCGAVIISPNRLLTAAHCLFGRSYGFDSVRVNVGTEKLNGAGGESYVVDRAIIHPLYNPEEFGNDIAVLTLKTNLRWSSRVQAIKIAPERPRTGKTAFVSGWGRTNSTKDSASDSLQYLGVTIMDNRECDELYRAGGKIATGNYFCTMSPVGKGSCQGDSGGPLTYNNQLLGVVSFGDGCASGTPVVFTSLAKYIKWISLFK